ncbi:MAG TPA: cation-translocating P-type ATPase [Firmicutes bacterium]|nr:cation-translocating P-type ATPase [Bacillota bacterium]
MSANAYYQQRAEAVLKELGTDAELGLSTEEVKRRAAQFGPNALVEHSRSSLLVSFLRQFQDFMVMVLIAAACISVFLGETADALAILAIVFCNGLLGFIQEHKAERSLAALRELAASTCIVLRDGREQEVPAAELVPGDIVFLNPGQRVPADGRLLETNLLAVEEAALTGESNPVGKDWEYMPAAGASLGDLRNSVFMGTTVVRGKGKFIVTRTGMDTEIGKIAAMIQGAPVESTPLQRRLEQLGRWLVAGCLLVVAVVFAIGVIQGVPFYQMFLTGVSLAVAAIPEGLPAAVTIAHAVGVQRMSRRNAVVRRLPAVETLGCATVICSDKTGTLTQNIMTVREIHTAAESYQVTGRGYQPQGCLIGPRGNPVMEPQHDLKELLTAAVVCNNARIYPQAHKGGYLRGLWRRLTSEHSGDRHGEWHLTGDPTEGALLVAAAKAGFYREQVEKRLRRCIEFPFDSGRKRMTVITKGPESKPTAWTKGAPDVILELCTHILKKGSVFPISTRDKQQIRRQYEAMSSSALRVLAFAKRDDLPGVGADALRSLREGDIERNLIFLGLMGMMDPPRPEAVKAVAQARRAGIRTIMVTGDHANTALAVGRELGLVTGKGRAVTGAELDGMDDLKLREAVGGITVFARVRPEHKVRIVRALKARGEIVGMTGDGINDAPAVKEADIGIAMGRSGTDVTKEASDIVLADDNFATIVAAIEEGRVIYENIRKFIRYLLGCNVGEVLTMLLAAVAGLPMPLVPIQILWMNLVTDGLPAVALSVDPGDPDIMERGPRSPKEGLFSRGLHLRIVLQGLLIGLSTLAVFAAELFLGSGTLKAAQTMAFTTLVVGQLVYVFQCRSEQHRMWELGLWDNPWLVGAVLASALMQLGVLYVPLLQPIFNTVPLTTGQWAVVLFFSGVCGIAGDIAAAVHGRLKARLTVVRV